MVFFIGLDSLPTYDGIGYDRFAVQIAKGEGYHTEFGPTASKPPLYPFFMAGVYLLFGSGNWAALRLLQALLDSFSCVLLYFLAKSLRGRSVGLLSAIAAIFYPLSIYMSAQIYPETLFLFLLNGMLLISVKMVRCNQNLPSVTCGVLFGFAILARPNILGLLPLVILYPFLLTSRWVALRSALVFLFAVLLVLAPWSVRNYLIFHEFVPLTTEGGGECFGLITIHWRMVAL